MRRVKPSRTMVAANTSLRTGMQEPSAVHVRISRYSYTAIRRRLLCGRLLLSYTASSFEDAKLSALGRLTLRLGALDLGMFMFVNVKLFA